MNFWHFLLDFFKGACFNATSGDIEDYPGLDSLPKYDVEEDASGNVLVKGCFDKESISKRKPLCVKKGAQAETVVIIVNVWKSQCF